MDGSQDIQDQEETEHPAMVAVEDIPGLGREELDRELGLLQLILQKQQLQMRKVKEQLGGGKPEDIELFMSLEVQGEILEEKLADTLRRIQLVTSRLNTLGGAVEQALAGVEAEGEPAAELVEELAGELEEELDQLLGEIAEEGEEQFQELEADVSDIVSDLTEESQEELAAEEPETAGPGELPDVVEIEEDEGELEPSRAEPAQAAGPAVPATPSTAPDPLAKAREALQKADTVKAGEGQRKRLSKSMLSEMEQASTRRTPTEPSKRRYRKRRDLEPQPLSEAMIERRRKVRASSLRSATVLSFKKCEKCGAVVPANFKICGRCGNMLKSLCPSCGAHIPRGVEYCSSCNKRVMY